MKPHTDAFPARLETVCHERRVTRRDVIDHFESFAEGDRRRASKATVNRWFTGVAVPDWPQAVELSRLLGVSLDALASARGPASAPSVTLSDDEQKLLWIAQRVGVQAAIDRIIQVVPVSHPTAEQRAAKPGAAREKKPTKAGPDRLNRRKG